MIDALELRFEAETPAVLADGNTVFVRLFLATVEWEGQDRHIEVLELEGGPLAGMALLYGHNRYVAG